MVFHDSCHSVWVHVHRTFIHFGTWYDSGAMLGEMVFRITDGLATSLQSGSLTASGGRQLAAHIIIVLERMRCDRDFALFKAKVDNTRESLGMLPNFHQRGHSRVYSPVFL